MVGGEDASVKPLEPIFHSLAPEGGYLHVGGPGAGHYVKMVHNGIEYGLMQAYAEGFEIMHASDYPLDLGGDLRDVDARLRRPLVAAGADGPRVQGQRPGPGQPQGLGRGLRRGPLDGAGGDRQGRPGAGHHALAARPASARARTTRTARRCSPRCATSSAATRSRPSSDGPGDGGRAPRGGWPGAQPEGPPAPRRPGPAVRHVVRGARRCDQGRAARRGAAAYDPGSCYWARPRPAAPDTSEARARRVRSSVPRQIRGHIVLGGSGSPSSFTTRGRLVPDGSRRVRGEGSGQRGVHRREDRDRSGRCTIYARR